MSKSITITMGDQDKREISISGIRFLKIVGGQREGKEGERPIGFQSKLMIAGEAEPIYAFETVKELRSAEFPLVYMGGGIYAPRVNIARVEPLTETDRKRFAEEKGTKVKGFQTRVVLTGDLGTFWGVKSIDQLNEPRTRFVPVGEGAYVHAQNIRKIAELSDDDRARIAGRYNIDASGFRTQLILTGEDRPRLSRVSVAELKSAGLDLVASGEGEFVVGQNVKFFGPFGAEDQERLAAARDGLKADVFTSKLTLAWGLSPVLSTRSVDDLRAALRAVNVGYDRHVPVENIVAEKIGPFTKAEKSALSEAGYTVERAWKSSVGLVNGLVLSPATPEQIRQRCEKARAHYAAQPVVQTVIPEPAAG